MVKNANADLMVPVVTLARSLGLSPQTVRNLIATGELQAVNTARPGALRPRYAVTIESLNDFLVARKVTAKNGRIVVPRKSAS